MILGRTTSQLASQSRTNTERDNWPICDECVQAADPEEHAPSCGAHILCVSCYTTADFRCRECLRVWRELDEPRWAS